MLGEQNTPNELLTAFYHDAEWWKLTVSYIQNEMEFINRLLTAHAYKENIPNLFEHIQKFKHELATKTRETLNFKKELLDYEDKLRGILECEDISCDTFYLENHSSLKARFEHFYTHYNDFKINMFNYLGANLLSI